MKHKVAELEGALLDAAVAECERLAGRFYRWELIPEDTSRIGRIYCSVDAYGVDGAQWEPSTDWADGGPIIDRDGIELSLRTNPREWVAMVADSDAVIPGGVHRSALVAAMRAKVTDKFGHEVELP